MDNKKYLKWYNKIGYGSGDIAGNVVYAFLATFVMIYLTDTAGLNAGIVGTLMMVSKSLTVLQISYSVILSIRQKQKWVRQDLGCSGLT